MPDRSRAGEVLAGPEGGGSAVADADLVAAMPPVATIAARISSKRFIERSFECVTDTTFIGHGRFSPPLDERTTTSPSVQAVLRRR